MKISKSKEKYHIDGQVEKGHEVTYVCIFAKEIKRLLSKDPNEKYRSMESKKINFQSI